MHLRAMGEYRTKRCLARDRQETSIEGDGLVSAIHAAPFYFYYVLLQRSLPRLETKREVHAVGEYYLGLCAVRPAYRSVHR
jgi:hypothetical protein